jgi:hypothetical protein
MVSSTRQTERRRYIRARSHGQHKAAAKGGGTPKFPVHPDGYDPKAADAKKPKS